MSYKNEVNIRFTEICERLIETKKVKNKACLAKSLEIESNKLSEILSNRMRAGVSEIQKLCNEYGVSFDYIFNGYGEKKSQQFDTPNLTPQSDTPKQQFDTPKRHPKTSDQQKEITNSFTGMTDQEIKTTIKNEFRDHLLEMYETGRSVPAIEVQAYKEEIKELTTQVARQEYQITELRLQLAVKTSKSKHQKDETPKDATK